MMWINDYFVNASILLAILYLASFVHKKLLLNVSKPLKNVMYITVSVLGGWASMFYGIHLNNYVIFDLRFIPAIIAAVIFQDKYIIFVIAFLIGLLRFSFGISEAALVGFLNMIVMATGAITIKSIISQYKEYTKIIIIIITMNILNVLFVGSFGVIPLKYYLYEIVPLVMPLSIFFSILMVGMIKDLQNEFLHVTELKDIAAKDQLTSLHNRRALKLYQNELLNISKDTEQSVVAVFIDVDHFKKVNDTYGHFVGDLVLKDLAKKIKDFISEDDFASRFGGEEFIVIFLNPDSDSLNYKLEKFRKSIEKNTINVGNKEILITISMGVASSPPYKLKEIYHYADKALYKAKKSGRNRIEYY